MKKIFLLLAVAAALAACQTGPSTEVVNYRTYTDPDKGIFYIYDGVLDKGMLVSGVGGDAKRVYVTREGN